MKPEMIQNFANFNFLRAFHKLQPENVFHGVPDVLTWMDNSFPRFKVYAKQIKILYNPYDLYQTLLEKSSIAKNRIVLVSLYLGTGSLEKELVKIINKRLTEVPTLKVGVLLDCLRGCRGDPNSISMLLPVLKSHPETFKLSLYHTPELRGLVRKFLPARYNEIVGLQHMKFYVFDNDVIITGANLSSDYFTTRQDRYMVVSDCQPFADFVCGLYQRVSDFSFKVNKLNKLEGPDFGFHPVHSNFNKFKMAAFSHINDFYNPTIVNNNEGDTYIYPLLEMGPFNIHHDSRITRLLFENVSQASYLYLATGYFNLTQQYSKSIIENSKGFFKILTAHPQANGFLGAKGPAGGIPFAYRELANKFFKKVISLQQEHRIHLFEYKKPDWTFHAKGLWLSESFSQPPFLTLIGSPNFG